MVQNRGKRSVAAIFRAIETAWNKGNVREYALLYSRDAGYVTRGGTFWGGRAKIEKGHLAAFAKSLQGTVLKLRPRRIKILSRGVAIIHADVSIVSGKKRAGKTRALTTFVLKKNRARWSIAAAHTTEI